MSAEQEHDVAPPTTPSHDDRQHESLTDLMDRMDREAFHRALEQRQLRTVTATLQRHQTTRT